MSEQELKPELEFDGWRLEVCIENSNKTKNNLSESDNKELEAQSVACRRQRAFDVYIIVCNKVWFSGVKVLEIESLKLGYIFMYIKFSLFKNFCHPLYVKS